MDNLESLKEEEEKLVKDRRQNLIMFSAILAGLFVLQLFIDVRLDYIGFTFFLVLGEGIMYWRADYKLKKIRKEIEATKKE